VRESHHTSEWTRSAARLPVIALFAWALFALLVPAVSQALNLVDIFAFPLGYFMIAQGSLIALVLIGFVSARWQDRREARRVADR
jgi:putative solute:sodium symporter small subunit